LRGVDLKQHKNIKDRELQPARQMLAEDFIDDLREVWQRKGKAAIEKTADEHPEKFVAIVAGLLPQQIELVLSDKELATITDLVEALVAAAQR
jgi:hypothetical protein